MKCPCGSGQAYAACCGVFHAGTPAPTAELLMRSRYCAYALQKLDYLFATHHPQKRPASPESLREWAEKAEFIGLEILQTSLGGPEDKIGKVEFRAHYQENGRRQMMQEVSRFRRYQGNWVYYDGTFKG